MRLKKLIKSIVSMVISVLMLLNMIPLMATEVKAKGSTKKFLTGITMADADTVQNDIDLQATDSLVVV